MTMTTHSTNISTLPVLLAPPPVRFQPGELVVIVEAQPLVCVVLEEASHDLLRLSRAACPEVHILVSASAVQHLSAWLNTQVAPGRRPDRRGR